MTGDSGRTHYVIPWSDPYLYEYPFDYGFSSPAELVRFTKEYFDDLDDEEERSEWHDWTMVEVAHAKPLNQGWTYDEDAQR